jgi:ubiquinone/menaquinone biosynthesis C-methylase UbiE
MCAWKEKKEQQTIFDDVVAKPSNKVSTQKMVWQKDDGYIFVQEVTNYSKKVKRGGVIIDVGCGSGALLHENDQHVSNMPYLVGIDISPKSVKMAKQRNKAMDFIVCDICALPLRDKISSMIIVWNVLHHLPNLEPIKKLIRILGSPGYLLVDDKINGNPINEILISLYPLYPRNFRMVLKEKGNHIDCNGNLPPVKRYSPQTYLKTIQQQQKEVCIVEIKYHGFFLLLSVLGIVSYFFPKLSNLPIPVDKLRFFENHKILRWSAISMTIVAEKV